MRKKCFLFIICIFFMALLPAQYYWFGGISGDFLFPGRSSSALNPGKGGGVTLEGGLNFGFFDASVKLGYSHSGINGLVIAMDEFKLGGAAALNIDMNLLPFMPWFINLRPELSAYADLLNIKYYQTQSYMQRGMDTKALAFTCQLTAGISLDVPRLIYIEKCEVVPFAAYAFNIRFDQNGLINSNEVSLGARVFFGRPRYVKPVKEEEPAVEEPVVEEQVIEEPIIEELVVEEQVVEEPAELTVTLPPVFFAPNAVDFSGLTEKELETIHELLLQVVQILSEYPDYGAVIQGHANNVTGTEEEHLWTLIPMSKKRASIVVDELVKLGADESSLVIEAMGSDEPLAADETELWKNRRVDIEFQKLTEMSE